MIVATRNNKNYFKHRIPFFELFVMLMYKTFVLQKSNALKGQVFTLDASLSMGMLLLMLMFVFPILQKEEMQTDFTYSTLSRICRTHLFSGITSGTLGELAVADHSEKDSRAAAFLSSLPDYVGGRVLVQNSSGTYSYNDSVGSGSTVSASSFVYGHSGSKRFFGKAILTCWQK